MRDTNHLHELRENREACKIILLAEIAALLHNIGKLDPNFLADSVSLPNRETVLGDCFIKPQYSFKRFGKPSILSSSYKFEENTGPLFIPNPLLRQTIPKLRERVNQLQTQLSSLSGAQRDQLLEEINNLKQELREKEAEEERLWRQRERDFDVPSLVYGWSLGGLLSLFWDDFFEKPQLDSYVPGSDADPDYSRTPRSDIVLNNGVNMDLPRLLILSHGEASGHEKKGIDETGLVEVTPEKTEWKGLFLATAFGYEAHSPQWREWQDWRANIIGAVENVWRTPVTERRAFVEMIRDYLSDGLGDTHRPINEISLWDYSASIAALFKSAIAKAIIEGSIPHLMEMRWRFLSVRLDGLRFLLQVHRASDLIARRDLLAEAFNTVKELLEENLPLGNQVYCDENGGFFIVPDTSALSEDGVKTIVLKALRERGIIDIVPHIKLGDAKRGKQLNLGEEMLQHLLQPTQPFPEDVRTWWDGYREDVCAVCGLRPQGYMPQNPEIFVTAKKARERKVCGVCLGRRGRRSRDWAKTQQSRTAKKQDTIWIDEVADTNARVALIAARFSLGAWLDGSLIRSLALGTKESTDQLIPKDASFPRVRRVWSTAQKFWQQQEADIRAMLKDERRRLILIPETYPDVGEHHACELDLGGTSLSIVWDPKYQQEGIECGSNAFISADNFGYIARQLNAKRDVWENPAEAAIWVALYIQDRMRQLGKLVVTEQQIGAVGRERKIKIVLRDVDFIETAYATMIPILTEPQVFLALVPAEKALEVVEHIRTEYETQFSKVRNRLPLHLNLVFFQRRTPLYVAMDAARRMLERKMPANQVWRILRIDDDLLSGEVSLSLDLKDDASDERRPLNVSISYGLGDPEKDDNYYPYIFVHQPVEGHPLEQRQRCFKAPLPPANNLTDLVHVRELKQGDEIYYMPSTFDFEFLDVAARRFELHYADGRRFDSQSRPDAHTRPFWLEDSTAIERVRTALLELSAAQRKQIIGLVETKRAEWMNPNSGSHTHRQFVDDVLRNAGSGWWAKLERTTRRTLCDWTNSGRLSDVLELYETILKGEDESHIDKLRRFFDKLQHNIQHGEYTLLEGQSVRLELDGERLPADVLDLVAKDLQRVFDQVAFALCFGNNGFPINGHVPNLIHPYRSVHPRGLIQLHPQDTGTGSVWGEFLILAAAVLSQSDCRAILDNLGADTLKAMFGTGWRRLKPISGSASPTVSATGRDPYRIQQPLRETAKLLQQIGAKRGRIRLRQPDGTELDVEFEV
jgi:hypothetical protein